jgi:hypothetical protein
MLKPVQTSQVVTFFRICYLNEVPAQGCADREPLRVVYAATPAFVFQP